MLLHYSKHSPSRDRPAPTRKHRTPLLVEPPRRHSIARQGRLARATVRRTRRTLHSTHSRVHATVALQCHDHKRSPTGFVNPPAQQARAILQAAGFFSAAAAAAEKNPAEPRRPRRGSRGLRSRPAVVLTSPKPQARAPRVQTRSCCPPISNRGAQSTHSAHRISRHTLITHASRDNRLRTHRNAHPTSTRRRSAPQITALQRRASLDPNQHPPLNPRSSHPFAPRSPPQSLSAHPADNS
jgi:hypothetical protein